MLPNDGREEGSPDTPTDSDDESESDGRIDAEVKRPRFAAAPMRVAALG
jgi:hypothetical protein